MAIHPMGAVDAAWYHLDGAANRAIVTSLLVTETPLDFARTRAVLAERLAGFERFRQRVVEAGVAWHTPQWEDVALDIEQHVHHAALPAPGDRAALEALVAELASTALPRELPLWQAHVIDGVEGGSALVMRYHHCIGDGIAMMNVAQRLFDADPVASPRADLEAVAHAADAPALAWLFETVRRSADGLVAAAGQAWRQAAHLALSPGEAVQGVVQAARGAQALAGELLKPADPPSPFKGDFGPRQRVAWSRPFTLHAIRAVGAPFHASVNDVLVAALAGALRSYLQGRGVAVDQATLRALVPLNLRPAERAGALGNEFGLVYLALPIGAPNWVARIVAVKSGMDALKHSAEPHAMQWLLDLFGRGPKLLEDQAQRIFGSRASLVLTNVIGPRETLYLAGAAISRMAFWVPHPGDELGMGASVMSYRGKACVALMADARLVPDPQAIVSAFEREFARMRGSVKVAAAKLPAALAAGRPAARAAQAHAAKPAARRPRAR
jgi:WS/DGAT/MGAT family acyltransferase